ERRTAKGFSGQVDDALVRDVIGAYRKQLQKALPEFEKAGERGAAQVAQLRFEVAFCERYLPKGLDETELRALVGQRLAALGMTGTFASEMPPCVRRRWPRRPERSWSFCDAPMQVSARLMTATSPSRSSGSSNRRAAVARSHTVSTPGIALATFMTSAGSRLARQYTRTKPPSAPWWATNRSVIGQPTVQAPLPNRASRTSWSQMTFGEPSGLDLSFIPWSAVSATVAP